MRPNHHKNMIENDHFFRSFVRSTLVWAPSILILLSARLFFSVATFEERKKERNEKKVSHRNSATLIRLRCGIEFDRRNISTNSFNRMHALAKEIRVKIYENFFIFRLFLGSTICYCVWKQNRREKKLWISYAERRETRWSRNGKINIHQEKKRRRKKDPSINFQSKKVALMRNPRERKREAGREAANTTKIYSRFIKDTTSTTWQHHAYLIHIQTHKYAHKPKRHNDDDDDDDRPTDSIHTFAT